MPGTASSESDQISSAELETFHEETSHLRAENYHKDAGRMLKGVNRDQAVSDPEEDKQAANPPHHDR